MTTAVPSDSTVVSESALVKSFMLVGFPLIGAGLIFAVERLTGWLLSLPWIPLQGPVRLIDRIPDQFAIPGALVIGAIAGLLLAFTAMEQFVVTVSPTKIALKRDDKEQVVQRDEVGAVFVDGKELVILAADTSELVREKSDLEAAALEAAFVGSDYPWSEGDPHRDAYHLWVPDSEGLPPGANAVLKARAFAVERDAPKHMTELRQELAKLGVVVRDDDSRQYWRTTAEGGGFD